MTEFDELKKEMRARLAYYFDTDEHEPITPEIVEEWMWKAINASINKERVWRSLWNIANDAKGGE